MSPLKQQGISKKKNSDRIQRLILGTASFGMSYGVTNERGKVPFDEIKTILELCKASGIEEIDTAQAYGDAEKILGEVGVSGFRITTKINLEQNDEENSINKKVRKSLERLKISKLQNLLLHNEEILNQKNMDSAIKAMHRMVDSGWASRIGLSSYNPLTALDLCKKHSFRVVQLPAHVLDNRLFQDGVFEKFISEEIEVQIRSIFLQGVLLKNPHNPGMIPNELLQQAVAFRANCTTEAVRPLQAALGHVLLSGDRSKIVIGVSKTSELKKILNETTKAVKLKDYSPPEWNHNFDPRTWPLGKNKKVISHRKPENKS